MTKIRYFFFLLFLENGEYALVVGEVDELRINLNVTNFADSAYESQLFIVHQKSVNYISSVKGVKIYTIGFADFDKTQFFFSSPFTVFRYM